MQRHGAWKSASRHSAVRVVGRFTAKLTKRKFAFHHSGRRVVALIAAVSWHFGSTRASKSASRGPKHFAQEPARSTVFSAKPARSCEHEHSPKPGTDHDFLGKSGADLCGPEHLAKNPVPQSTVFSRQNRRGPARTLAFRPETYRGPRFCRQNRRGPCSGLLGITKVTIGTYPNWSSKPSIPCRSRAPSLAIVWGEGGVRIK